MKQEKCRKRKNRNGAGRLQSLENQYKRVENSVVFLTAPAVMTNLDYWRIITGLKKSNNKERKGGRKRREV